ncbi:MAG: M16 family metallopeptidase [Cyclobacteriaceae bacterium]
MKNLCVLSWILVMANTVSAQTKLIEKVEKLNDEVVIPYEKYELENGLQLIIHEDHSDPLVHVDVTYHVGSAREELNKSGFAHFFEHMMFQGSDNVADEEHFKIVTESGGTLNGSTNRDRTNYYQTVPSNQLERMLWLEADRMGFFLDAVTQEKFEIQRATVKNEKGQNYLNRPYGMWREKTMDALYPHGHPYSWSTIGLLKDLDSANLTDLKNFFLRWYGPNNAAITVGGDVNPKEVIALVEKYFGSIPRGPEVSDLDIDPITIDSDRYISHVDSNIRFPALMLTYPSVPNMHPDEAALDCLSEILGTGQSSYFFKKFVLTQKAIQASAFHPTSELAGEFSMFVLPYPGRSLADFEVEVRQILDDFAQNGVNENDLVKFKASRESNTINGLASVSGKVSQLAAYQYTFSNPNMINKDLQRYLDVTAEDVMRVFNEYIYKKPGVVLSYLPNEETAPAKPDNFEKDRTVDNPYPITDYSGLKYNKASDDFDRSVKPEPGASPLVKVPEFWKEEFENGMKLIGTKSDEIPTVAIQINLDGGHKFDTDDPAKSGLALITASLMNESTENYSAEEMQEELRKIGSSIAIYGDNNSTTVSINTLVKNLDRTLELVNEKLFRPAFNQEDFDRVIKQQMEGIIASQKDPSAIASQVFNRLLYGDEHIYSVPSSGIEETVQNISVEDIKDFYAKYFSPNLGEVVVVGAIEQEEILPKLNFLEKWKSKNLRVPKLPAAQAADKAKIYLVDKENAPQSQIRIGYVTDLTYDPTGEYYKTYLMNYPLGGAFNSRINLNLREENGWTYGARSYFSVSEDPGPYVATAGVLGTATDSSVVEFMKEIKEYRENGITEDELAFMRNSIGQRDARSYETPGQKAGFLSRIVHYGLDAGYVDEQTKIINTITKKELDALAEKHLKDENFYILVVGDGASNRSKLEKLGYELVELDAKGNVIEETQLDVDK